MPKRRRKPAVERLPTVAAVSVTSVSKPKVPSVGRRSQLDDGSTIRMAALSPVSRYESDALRAAKAVRRWVTAHHRALLAAAGVFVLLLLLSAVHDVLRDVRYDEIVAAMKATTATQLALAALATLLSYAGASTPGIVPNRLSKV